MSRTVLRGDHAELGEMQVTPDGALLYATRAASVVVWSASTLAELRRFDGHGDTVHAIAVSPDGRRLATGSNDRTARVWALEDDAVGLGASAHRGAPWRDAHGLDRTGELALVTGPRKDGTTRVAVVSTRTGEVRGEVPVGIAPPWELRLSGSGGRVAAVGAAGLEVLDVATGAVLVRRDGLRVTGAAMDDAGRVLVFRLERTPGDRNEAVHVLDVDAGGEARPLRDPVAESHPWHAFAFGGVRVSPDGTYVAVARGYRGVTVWNAATGEAVLRTDNHDGMVVGLAFSPDERLIATQAKDSTIAVTEIRTGWRSVLTRFRQRRGALAFTADGARLVAVPTNEDPGFVYDVASAQRVARITAPGGAFAEVVVTPDGTAVIRERDGVVRRWPADPVAWIADRLPRELSMPEWEQIGVGPEDEGIALHAAELERWRSTIDLAGFARQMVDRGRIDDAERMLALALDTDADQAHVQMIAAMLAATRGDVEAAFAHLDAAEAIGMRWVEILRHPAMAPLRTDPRWRW